MNQSNGQLDCSGLFRTQAGIIRPLACLAQKAHQAATSYVHTSCSGVIVVRPTSFPFRFYMRKY